MRPTPKLTLKPREFGYRLWLLVYHFIIRGAFLGINTKVDPAYPVEETEEEC